MLVRSLSLRFFMCSPPCLLPFLFIFSNPVSWHRSLSLLFSSDPRSSARWAGDSSTPATTLSSLLRPPSPLAVTSRLMPGNLLLATHLCVPPSSSRWESHSSRSALGRSRPFCSFSFCQVSFPHPLPCSVLPLHHWPLSFISPSYPGPLHPHPSIRDRAIWPGAAQACPALSLV